MAASRGAVVGARLAALGDRASRRSRRSPRSSVAAVDSTAAGAGHVADGAEAHASSSNGILAVSVSARSGRRQQHPVAPEDQPLVARSRSTAARAPRARMYCHTSSSVQFEIGNTRTCSPVLDGGRCRCSRARGAAPSGPTGRARRGTRRRAPWRASAPRRGERRRRPRRSGARAIASSSVTGLEPVAGRARARSRPDHAAGVDRVLARDATISRAPSSADAAVAVARSPRGSCGPCPRASAGTGSGPGQKAFWASRRSTIESLPPREQQHRVARTPPRPRA